MRAFGAEAFEKRAYDRHAKKALKDGLRDARAGGGTFLVNYLLDYGAGVLILWFGGLIAMQHAGDGAGGGGIFSGDSLTPGRLVTYQLYFSQIQNAYNNLISMMTSFTRASGSGERILELLARAPAIDPDAGALARWEGRAGALTFDDVRFAYAGRPREVLCGVRLHVPPGATCAIVGRSGGGKTTLMNLVLRYYDPTAGRVLLDGDDIATLNPSDYRASIGVVSQETQLFSSSVLDNIAYVGDEAEAPLSLRCSTTSRTRSSPTSSPPRTSSRPRARRARTRSSPRSPTCTTPRSASAASRSRAASASASRSRAASCASRACCCSTRRRRRLTPRARRRCRRRSSERCRGAPLS